MKRRRSVHLALAAIAIAITGASGIACPERELDVQITRSGADTLVSACEAFRDACNTAACPRNHFLCDQRTCTLKGVCDLKNNLSWAPENTMGLRLLLLEAGTDEVVLKNATACIPLNLRPCIQDASGKNGCTAEVPDTAACITSALSQAVQTALGSGFTFSGFTNPDSVALVAAFYHKPGDEASCDLSVLVRPDDCARSNLVAVTGLAAPIGSSTYDITCASCQGSTHSSVGRDNAPCPVTANECFLQRVDDALMAAGE